MEKLSFKGSKTPGKFTFLSFLRLFNFSLLEISTGLKIMHKNTNQQTRIILWKCIETEIINKQLRFI